MKNISGLISTSVNSIFFLLFYNYTRKKIRIKTLQLEGQDSEVYHWTFIGSSQINPRDGFLRI